jgi:integrase
MEIRLPGLKVYRSRGKIYVYHRKTRTRLRAPIGSAAFVAAIEQLNGRTPPAPKPGTLGSLIAAYRASPEFAGLAPRTRDDYGQVFEYLQPLAGHPLTAITSSYVIEVRDAAFARHKRRWANYVLAVLRLLLKWGVARDLVDTNPAAAVPQIRRPRQAAPANRPWTRAECDVVLAAATGGIQVAIALGMFAGMREGDAITLPRAAYDGVWLRWRQGKTGHPVAVPAHPALQALLDQWLQEQALAPAPVEALTLVVGVRGRPYTIEGFRRMFFGLIRALEQAGKVGPDLTFHGLRHTAGAALADQGVEPRTIAALLGHRTLAMAAHYSEGADREKRAAAAVKKLYPRRRTTAKVSSASGKCV